ncbi:hypothetical protein [Pleionea litopenaei]|uniref:Uncharacterized protein n=1 Tax=Pleionea litopenaei TaxID=3070815 RepID=A0AA51RTK9_9GAMM|nr:hypothetical protein [Pleionea sp. HL-JVS1]WMS87391.1 hypothetical protein Q9312_00325 [Pleionea sp. HL-JVS1]
MKKIRVTATVDLTLDEEFDIEKYRRDICLRYDNSYIIPEIEFLSATKDGGKALAFKPVNKSDDGLAEALYGSVIAVNHTIEDIKE